MKWKEFNPGNGNLRAEGLGYLLTSRYVNSLGICLEYATTPLSDDAFDTLGNMLQVAYLPVGGVSDLVFGIVPHNKSLCRWDRPIGSFENISEWLKFLDNTGARNLHLTGKLKQAMIDKPGWIPGFNDIIPLTAPKFSRRTSLLCNIPMPNAYRPGLLRTREGLVSFANRLRIYVDEQRDSASPRLKNVLAKINSLKHNDSWEADDSGWACLPIIGRDLDNAIEVAFAFQDEVHRALDETEAAMVDMNVDPSGFYEALLAEHIRMAIGVHEKVMKKDKDLEEKEGTHREGRRWLSLSMDTYWDELSDLKKRVAKCTDCTEQLAGDAWIMMIFRAFCWHHCHRLLPQTMILPVEWHRSQIPVYIG